MYAFFFFNDTATTEIYTLSLHDALPICRLHGPEHGPRAQCERPGRRSWRAERRSQQPEHPAVNEHARRRSRLGLHRSEEHTSELQSRQYLVCRLLLEKKKQTTYLIL